MGDTAGHTRTDSTYSWCCSACGGSLHWSLKHRLCLLKPFPCSSDVNLLLLLALAVCVCIQEGLTRGQLDLGLDTWRCFITSDLRGFLSFDQSPQQP